MSFMDKVKAQAEQAVAKAQTGVAQGQAKIETLQATKAQNELLRALGAAYYDQQRHGGPADAVTAALTALDDYSSTHGAIDLAAPADAAPAAAAPAATPAAPPAAAAGDFTL